MADDSVGWGLKQSIVKGSIKLLEEPGTRQEFQFNPNTIKDTKGANWLKGNVASLSHPVYQFGSGTERSISFELHHDGDRGRILTGSGGTNRIADDPGLDISDWLRFWRSLVYPVGSEEVQSTTAANNASGFSYFANRAPSKVIFNFGAMWVDVVCVCLKADIEATTFDPSLGVTRATVAVTLEEAPDVLPVYASDVRLSGGLI